MRGKMNSRIITQNPAADPEKGFLTKSVLKPCGRATGMPPAWELNYRLVFKKGMSSDPFR